MNPAALTPEQRASAPDLALRLGGVLAALAALVASAFLKNPQRVALINPLWRYITRTSRRFARAMERLAAGTPSRPGRPGTPSGARPVRLPTSHAWLVVELRHMAAGYASQLNHLLAEPEAAALLAASPQAARILRPLCHLLGIRPASVPPLPRRERPAAAIAPRLARQPAPTLQAPRKGLIEASTRTDPRPIPSAWSPRTPPPLCPRMLDRWPWVPHPNAKRT